jgi:hypothetical protein
LLLSLISKTTPNAVKLGWKFQPGPDLTPMKTVFLNFCEVSGDEGNGLMALLAHISWSCGWKM